MLYLHDSTFCSFFFFFFFKQKTAYEIPKRDWSSDVCSSDLCSPGVLRSRRRELSAPKRPMPCRERRDRKSTPGFMWSLSAVFYRSDYFFSDATAPQHGKSNHQVCPRNRLRSCRSTISVVIRTILPFFGAVRMK